MTTTKKYEEVINKIKNGELKLVPIPFVKQVTIVDIIKNNSGVSNGYINYGMIELFKVVNTTIEIMELNDIPYELVHFTEEDIELTEEGKEINFFTMYDEMKKVYDIIYDYEYSLISTIEQLLNREIRLAESKYVSMGQFEGRIIEVLEGFQETVSKISEVVKDESKLKNIVNEVKKMIPKNLQDVGVVGSKVSKTKAVKNS